MTGWLVRLPNWLSGVFIMLYRICVIFSIYFFSITSIIPFAICPAGTVFHWKERKLVVAKIKLLKIQNYANFALKWDYHVRLIESMPSGCLFAYAEDKSNVKWIHARLYGRVRDTIQEKVVQGPQRANTAERVKAKIRKNLKLNNLLTSTLIPVYGNIFDGGFSNGEYL